MKGSIDPIPEEESDEIDHFKSRVPARENEEKAMYPFSNKVKRSESFYLLKTNAKSKQNWRK